MADNPSGARNPRLGGGKAGRVPLTELENRGVPDAGTVVAGFRGKELDVIANGLGPQDTEPIRKANPTEVVVTDTVLYGPADEAVPSAGSSSYLSIHVVVQNCVDAENS